MVIAITSQFDGNYENFDPVVARKLANLIEQAYNKQFPAWDKHDSTTSPSPVWNLDEPMELVELLATATKHSKVEKVPFGFVACDSDKNNVFVVFRGTLKFIEWFKNTKIRLVSYQDGNDSVNRTSWLERIGFKKREEDIAEGIQFDNQSQNIGSKDFGRVTAGFRGMYVALRQQMIDALNNLQLDTNARVFVTGHSLGGALATLAIPDIMQNTNLKSSQITLYTFASPRCGDRTFATEFQKTGVQHWRIANSEDLVTMIPFPTGNIFKAADPKIPYDPMKVGRGGTNANPNPIFGFFKDMYNRNKRRMPDYVHTGTPIYFTIHEASLERQHNLAEVYMLGIGQKAIPDQISTGSNTEILI